VPLVIAILMLVWLPESLQFLAVRGGNPDRLARWLKQLDPTLQIGPATKFTASETSRQGVPFWHLFRDGRAFVTILFWIVNFTNILALYSLAGWLPLIFQSLMGYDRSTANLLGTFVQVGGTVGAFGLAWLITRAGFTPMLAATFAVATASVALIGQPGFSLPVLYVIVTIAGWCIVGGQPGLNALASSYYPTYLRSTGVGAGLGVGRIGALVGPLIGGALIAAQWTPQQLLWAAAVAPAISTAVIVVLWAVLGRTPKSADATPAPALAH
jgi:AAHS family 4-hydroxybenzoate transporter-like MFS transporter